jgi:rhodanese-related sulfurtransferase
VLGKLDYKIIGFMILFLVCLMGHSPVSAVVWSDDIPIRTDISVNVANDMINNNTGYPDLLVLDVREQWEYDINHLHDALLIPLGELESRLDEIESHNETEIIVYCRTGVRSQEGSDILVANNFTKVFNMLGGITAWIDAGYDYWSNETTTPNGIDPLIIGTIGGVGVVFVIILILSYVRRR